VLVLLTTYSYVIGVNSQSFQVYLTPHTSEVSGTKIVTHFSQMGKLRLRKINVPLEHCRAMPRVETKLPDSKFILFSITQCYLLFHLAEVIEPYF
jgi:hypothetical protein